MNVLLTGKVQVGKTTVCQAVADLARARGYHPQGVLTPALHDGSGAKVGFETLGVGSGQRWLLAHSERELDGPRVGRYTFDAAGLARAIAVLRRASSVAGDLLIVDEIGPLELAQGGGFVPVLDRLPLQGPGHVLIVVRSALLPALRCRLSGADFAVFTVTEENRDTLPHRIVQELWPYGGNPKAQSAKPAFPADPRVNVFGF